MAYPRAGEADNIGYGAASTHGLIDPSARGGDDGADRRLTVRAPVHSLYWCTMIIVDGLTKTYGSLAAVSGLSFSVAGGEVVGLIGPNGAGKTTTLRCMAGIQAPTSGAIRIDGHDIVADAVEAKRAPGVHARRAAAVRVPHRSRSTSTWSRGSTASATTRRACRRCSRSWS